MNIINWIIERFRERSTKSALVTLLGILAMTGVIKPDRPARVIEIVDQGQAIYHEGVDSVGAAIDLGKALYEEGKGAVVYARDTAEHFWNRIGQLLALVGISFGVFAKDAKGGREYEERERALVALLKTRGVSEAEVQKVLS